MAKQPRYMGGQAVVEGVMMRGEDRWAVAVRTPEGDIEVVTHPVPRWAERYAAVPLVRGVANLAESLALGMKALTWSANRQVPEEEQVSGKAMGATMGIAFAFFAGVFILIPALSARGLAGRLGLGKWQFHLLEGLLSLSVFLGYLVLIGRLRDIRRVFQYHGAEHKAIAAYENGAPLTPEHAQRFTTEHVRCGTNFLLTVFVIAILVYSMIGRPSLPIFITSRVVMIPVIAGLAYEVIRLAARHMDRRWVRIAMIPGLTLQRLTTREPTLDQLEVAIASLRAVFTPTQLHEVEARRAA